MPKISVIIPVYNTGKYLSECLDSVLAQTFYDFEVICINDGSTDDSAKILAEYEKIDKRIRVINQQNAGVVVARNNGVQHSCGEYIYPLDSDDIIVPQCLERLYHTIITTKNRVVASQVMTFGKKTELFIQPKFNKYQMYGWHECCVISALFYKKDFEKFGGYSSKFNGYGGDDMDYWLNYMDHNLPMTRLDEVLFLYRIKEDEESVWKNYELSQRQKRYIYKEKMLQERHPKVIFYTKLRKFCHTKLVRFLYRVVDKQGTKIIKIFKFPVYKTKSKLRKLFFFNAEPNFGDQLNIYLLRDLFGINVYHSNPKKCDMVAIGSLLQEFITTQKPKKKKTNDKPVKVWGTGFINPEPIEKHYLIRKMKICALRGKVSLQRMQKYTGKKLKNIPLGDPGLLSNRLIDYKNIHKKYKLGIIPHYVDKKNPLLDNIQIENSIIIDVQQDPITVLKQIAECENILSSAMHGLIAADSLNIPNARIILSDKIVGGDYKFRDYYSAFDMDLPDAVVLSPDTKITNIDFIKENYKINPEQVENICKKLLKTL